MIKNILKKSLLLLTICLPIISCSNNTASVEEPAYVDPGYITFTGSDTFSLATVEEKISWDGVLLYSTDLDNWKIWDGKTITCGDDKKIYLKGMCNTYITQNFNHFVLTPNVDIACTGNLMTILDFEKVQKNIKITPYEFCFGELFYDCITNLTEGPDIITDELPYGACKYMYYYCKNLKKPSKLTATTLGNECYSSMYYQCISLETAPELPATNLGPNCYHSMFEKCTSLKETPKLNATKLKSNCYCAMFAHCTALEKTYPLPATESQDSCYALMFQGCTNLKQMPNIYLESLSTKSLQSMFDGCQNIKVYSNKPNDIETYEWTCPNKKEYALNCADNMFASTGGEINTPTLGTTYYIAK